MKKKKKKDGGKPEDGGNNNNLDYIYIAVLLIIGFIHYL